MTLTSQQSSTGHPGPVPQVVASYATYLWVRTGVVPRATVIDDQAGLTLGIGGKTLVLAFECHRREWSLRSGEVRDGEQATAFTCSREPSYLQLAGILRARIDSGEIAPEEALPSITYLVQETGLAVGTIRKAIKVLADEGLIVTVPGRGSFVTRRD